MAGVDHQPLIVRLVDQGLEQFFPQPFIPPAAKPPLHILPIAQIRRQIPPRRTGPQNPEHSVDEQPVVLGDPAPDALTPRQVRLQ